MYKKKFVEALKPLDLYDKSFEELYSKIEKWVLRGKPIKVEGFQLFHNGDLIDYDSMFNMVEAIYTLRHQVNYCTCIVCVKTLKDKKKVS